MVEVRSITTSRSMAPGIAARSWGSASRTRLVVSMIFAPGCLYMITSTEGLPLNNPALRTSSTESTTSATSERRTGAPFTQASTSGRYSLACRAWSSAASCHWRSPASTAPLGRLALAAAKALRT